MNIIFFLIVFIAFLFAAYSQCTWIPDTPDALAPMQVLSNSMLASAQDAIILSIGLVGVMTLFLGLMKIAEEGGLLIFISKLLHPLLKPLFPEVPADHPAMGAVVMNLSANILGLGNAATPFGIRAMQELDKLNPIKGTATNAMVMFLAINTSSVTLLPIKVIALRQAAGSVDPGGIIATTLFATICSTAIAIFCVKLFQRWFYLPQTTNNISNPEKLNSPSPSFPLWACWFAILLILSLVPLTIFYGKTISPWIIPSLMFGLLLFGIIQKINIYESFIQGAKEGFQVAVRIMPYLVAILVAIGMFRASGAMDLFINLVGGFTAKVGLPPEALPMALLRPLSGSGSLGVMASIINDPAIGPDSYVGYLVSTLMGSTETTFYVLAVYFGAIQIRRLRHAVLAALCADLAGIIASVYIVKLLYA